MDIHVMELKTNKAVVLDAEEILYIIPFKKTLLIYTHSSVYRPVYSLMDIKKHLKNQGFENLDRSNLVNMAKITRFDPHSKIVFFDKDGSPSRACHVARSSLDKVKHLPN